MLVNIIRIASNPDWKGRPYIAAISIGVREFEDTNGIKELIDNDVKGWQKVDIDQHNQFEAEEAEETGESSGAPITNWKDIPNHFEMDLKGDIYREFGFKTDEVYGNLVYRAIPIPVSNPETNQPTRFIKLDLADCDNATRSFVEGESLEGVLKNELAKAMADDRFEPCHGFDKIIDIRGNSLIFLPGDGGIYTIAKFFPDTEEGRAELNIELGEPPTPLTVKEAFKILKRQEVLDRSALFVSDPVNGDQILVGDNVEPLYTGYEGTDRDTVRNFLSGLDWGCYEDVGLIVQVYPR